MYYIGLDVHKKTISYCVKDGSSRIHAEGAIPATRFDLDNWMKTLPQPWTAAMEATIFTSWIYDHLFPPAAAVKVAHPLMLRAIAAAKKENDRIDAHKIADCLRCDFLPECYMASTEIRERRRTLRYRNLLVRQAVQMKNKIAVLLMEAGVSYNKQKLHKVGYFRELLAINQDIDDGLRSLLRLCRETVVLNRAGTTAERHQRELKRPEEFGSRASPKRVRRAFALLTRTYHGRRIIGN
jgi:transposase